MAKYMTDQNELRNTESLPRHLRASVKRSQLQINRRTEISPLAEKTLQAASPCQSSWFMHG